MNANFKRICIVILFLSNMFLLGCKDKPANNEISTHVKPDGSQEAGSLPSEIPDWAKGLLSKEQIEGAKKDGVPPAIEEEIAEGVKIRMVYIPAGEFEMGYRKKGRDANEKYNHKIRIKEGYYIGIYEITQSQWKSVMGKNPSRFQAGFRNTLDDTSNYPIEQVSWVDTKKYIIELNKKADKLLLYRLPSEAEWEYACRAGTSTRFYWGDDNDYSQIGDYAWYDKNSKERTHPVGGKKPNKWGLYDMSGNVWEWCEDDWHDNYIGAPDDGRPWINRYRSSFRVIRGGAWNSFSQSCCSDSRLNIIPDTHFVCFGFRVVRDLHEK